MTVSGFWWTLRQVWPGRQTRSGFDGIIDGGVPGFHAAVDFSIAYQQHFTCYALFTLSLGFIAWGMRKPKWFWVGMVLSLITSTVQLLTMEYFVGLGFIRPVLIWVMLRYPQDKNPDDPGQDAAKLGALSFTHRHFLVLSPGTLWSAFT